MVSVSTERDAGVLTVAVSGDVDIATGPVVSDAISEALAAEDAESVRVDLSGVRFLDSSGIALLLRARRDADERGRGFWIIGAQGVTLQVLEVTGVLSHLSGESGR